MRILLADDHLLFRKGVAATLASRPGLLVVGEAADGLEAVARARDTLPDLILMDVHMPRCDGLEATRRIKRERPGVVVIMLTVSDNDQDLFAAIKAGASGYLMKDLEPAQLFQLVEAAGRGEAALPGPIAARVLQEFRDHVTLEPPTAGLAELSERERDVLKQLAGGANNREIAEALSIAENTVKIHLRNILEKLHLNNRVQAAVYAARHGLGG